MLVPHGQLSVLQVSHKDGMSVMRRHSFADQRLEVGDVDIWRKLHNRKGIQYLARRVGAGRWWLSEIPSEFLDTHD